jgi:hypothetical protein
MGAFIFGDGGLRRDLTHLLTQVNHHGTVDDRDQHHQTRTAFSNTATRRNTTKRWYSDTTRMDVAIRMMTKMAINAVKIGTRLNILPPVLID